MKKFQPVTFKKNGSTLRAFVGDKEIKAGQNWDIKIGDEVKVGYYSAINQNPYSPGMKDVNFGVLERMGLDTPIVEDMLLCPSSPNDTIWHAPK